MIGLGILERGVIGRVVGRRGVKNQTAVLDEDGDGVARVGCEPSEETARSELLKEVRAYDRERVFRTAPFWFADGDLDRGSAEKVRTPMFEAECGRIEGSDQNDIRADPDDVVRFFHVLRKARRACRARVVEDPDR